MVRIKVLRSFWDLVVHVDRKVGDEFEVTEKRAAHIQNKLPGYVTVIEAVVEPEEDAKEPVDLAKLTVATLKGLCAERGIEVPKKAKKADIIALLEG